VSKTAGKHFRELCDLLSSTFHDRVTAFSFVEAFDALISRARHINDYRNRIVHSWWFTDPDGDVSRLKLKHKSSKFDSEDLDVNEIAGSINTLIDDFARFVDELSAAKLIKRPGIWLDSL
jgi:hypothetical protein